MAAGGAPGRAVPAGVPAPADDGRAAAAERLLRERGVRGARVAVAGREREIAAVTAGAPQLTRLAELAPELKALGFRYVALDLAESAGDG